MQLMLTARLHASVERPRMRRQSTPTTGIFTTGIRTTGIRTTGIRTTGIRTTGIRIVGTITGTITTTRPRDSRAR